MRVACFLAAARIRPFLNIWQRSMTAISPAGV